jgi:mRNA interferase HicA
MKRRELLRHLNNHGCELIREGGNHSWWLNPLKNKRSAIPRHSEIQDLLVRKICKDLEYRLHGHRANRRGSLHSTIAIKISQEDRFELRLASRQSRHHRADRDFESLSNFPIR